MKRIAIIATTLLCILFMAGCKTTQKSVADNESMPAWLQEKLPTLNERFSTITLVEMDGESYYRVFVKGPERSYDMDRTTIYRANGDVYFTTGGLRKMNETEAYFNANARNKGVIWKSDIVTAQEGATMQEK